MSDILQNRKMLFAALGVLVLGAAVWGGVSWSRHSPSSVPKEFTVEALKAKVEAENDPGKVWEQMHQVRDRKDLTEEQRHQVFENAHAVMEQQMDKRLDAYFATTDEKQRVALIDRDLDEMQKRMKERQARESQNPTTRPRGGPEAGRSGRGGMGGPGGGGGGTVAQGSGGGPGAGPGGGPPGGRRGEPTQQQRKMRTESRDPDQQARRMAYFSAMQKRAQQRGIQMPMFGRGGPGGPGGR